MKRIKAAMPAIVGATICSVQPAFGVPLIEPYAGIGLSYDDNALFQENDVKEDVAADLKAGLIFSNDTEAVSAKIEPSLKIHESFSDSSLSEISPALSITSRSVAERTTLNFNLKVQRDSTRTSEVVSTEDATATGIVVEGKDRLFIAASPSWLYRLTPRSSLAVNFGFSEADYDDAEDAGLFDYDNQVLSTRFVQNLTQKTDLWAGPSYRRYTSFDRDSSATTSGFDIGLDSDVSERNRVGFEIGWVSSEARLKDEKTNFDTVKVRTSLDRDWETGAARILFQHDVSPAGTGELYLTNRLTASFLTRFNSQFNGSMSLGYVDTEIARLNDNSSQRETVYFEPRMGVKLSSESSLDFSIRYNSEVTDGGSKERLKAGVSYVYRPAGNYL